MPTYEYQCEECGNRFEKLQKMSDAPLKDCPKCNAPVHRLISTGVGFIFRGSGSITNTFKNVYENQTRCGKDQTCCGRDNPCDTPPCEK